MKATLSRFNLILVLAWAVSAWTVSACSPSRPAPPPEPLAVKTLNRIVYDSKGSPDLSYSISNSEDGTPNVEILRYENSSKRGLTIEIPNGELKTKLKALFQGGVEVDSDPVRKDPATLILTYASGEVLTLESPRIKTAGAESLITDLNAVLLLKIGKYTESSGTGSPGTHTPTGSSPTPPTTSTSISTGVETHPGPPVIESGPEPRPGADLKTRLAQIMAEIFQIIPPEKNSHVKDPVYRYITSTPFNPTQDQKKKVYQLTRERLCLELQIFKTENRLDFPLDCMNQPGTFPELSLEVIKNAGIEKDDFIDPSGVRVMSSRIISILRFFIRVGDRRVLFKEENRVIVQERAGPKLVEGDMLTPEGRYDLKSGTTESKYFISTHIDYENWRDRKTLLSAEVPNRNARKIGGEIKIHGTGGSDGCVSLPNSEAALVAVWTNGSKNPSIDLYPQEMTDQNVSALLQKPEGRIYGDFWKATQTAYLDARRPDKVLGPEAKTIDDLLR